MSLFIDIVVSIDRPGGRVFFCVTVSVRSVFVLGSFLWFLFLFFFFFYVALGPTKHSARSANERRLHSIHSSIASTTLFFFPSYEILLLLLIHSFFFALHSNKITSMITHPMYSTSPPP